MSELLEEHKLKSGIEIGVKQGSYAKLILDGWKSCEICILVDLWAKQENYEDVVNVDNNTHDKFYEETKETKEIVSLLLKSLISLSHLKRDWMLWRANAMSVA